MRNLWETLQQSNNYAKKVTFDRLYGTESASNSERSEHSPESRGSRLITETEGNKQTKQPSVIHGSFTQIMMNPMQLQEHEFTALLDRLVEARRNRQDKKQ